MPPALRGPIGSRKVRTLRHLPRMRGFWEVVLSYIADTAAHRRRMGGSVLRVLHLMQSNRMLSNLFHLIKHLAQLS